MSKAWARHTRDKSQSYSVVLKYTSQALTDGVVHLAKIDMASTLTAANMVAVTPTVRYDKVRHVQWSSSHLLNATLISLIIIIIIIINGTDKLYNTNLTKLLNTSDLIWCRGWCFKVNIIYRNTRIQKIYVKWCKYDENLRIFKAILLNPSTRSVPSSVKAYEACIWMVNSQLNWSGQMQHPFRLKIYFITCFQPDIQLLSTSVIEFHFTIWR